MNVVVAAESVLLRAGLTRLLEDAGMPVVAQAEDAEDTVRKARAFRPDVVVIALADVPRREALNGAGVLVLAEDERAAFTLLDSDPRGVGYLIEPDVQRFISAVREVAAGGSVLDPSVVAQVVGRRSRRDALTEREREVLELMAEGRSNRAIAKRVYLSERAVERHVTSIFDKLRLEPSSKRHRRVLAVLAHVHGQASTFGRSRRNTGSGGGAPSWTTSRAPSPVA
ncbi:MAG TPA: response regulator transcription factor [Solirubrobacter sp.]|jgi:DNA-binding NarL/FixJ family response regulator|nr:response regulator transcription factor [Solirubrobacter sp.]